MKIFKGKRRTVIYPLIGMSLITILLGSCGSSNHVVSNHFIQKRKYNKGWFVQFPKRLKENTLAKVESNVVSAPSGISNEQEKQNQEWTQPIQPGDNTRAEQTEKQEEKDKKATHRNLHMWSIQQQIEKPLHTTQPFPIIGKTMFQRTDGSSNPGGSSRLKSARREYNKTWMFTAFAIAGLVGGFFLLDVVMFLGIVLLVATLTMYVFMFISLTRTLVHLAHHNYNKHDNSGIGITFFAWAHVVIGSIFAILLFWIPLLIVIIRVGIERKRIRNK